MRAMVLKSRGGPLELQTRCDAEPGEGQVRLRVQACAVCRTDLHVVDGDIPLPRLPIVPGHEIVGTVDSVGEGSQLHLGQRVGVTWLAGACGRCPFCAAGQENLCDRPVFTGLSVDGGFATHVVANSAFCVPLRAGPDAASLAPLMCAGVIGWRALRLAGDASRTLGIYGFGAAAHLMTQVAVAQDRRVYAFTRAGDTKTQRFARSVGATWAGNAEDQPPLRLDAAIIFAPVGGLVPLALLAVRKGGCVVCGGIHMSDLPAMPYRLLWEERRLVSVANLTRQDANEFLRFVDTHAVQVVSQPYALADANRALGDLRNGLVEGAAVLIP
jgi:propanol-preferring alcohol dehydrogenase